MQSQWLTEAEELSQSYFTIRALKNMEYTSILYAHDMNLIQNEHLNTNLER